MISTSVSSPSLTMANQVKSSDGQKASRNCAAIIANLEGRLAVVPPFDFANEGSLAALSIRAQTMEFLVSRDSPLPVVSQWSELTWESLALRVWSLDARVRRERDVVVLTFSDDTPGANGESDKKSTVDWSMLPGPHPIVTFGLLRETCVEVGLRFQRWPIKDSLPTYLWSLKHADANIRLHKDEEPGNKNELDEHLLEMIRQITFYIAGLNNHYITSVPETPTEMYKTLIELAMRLAMDKSNSAEKSSRGLSIFPPPPRLPPRKQVTLASKPCCGCCICTCHKAECNSNKAQPPAGNRYWGLHWDSASASSSQSSRTIIRESKTWLKPTSGFGWVRKIACWMGPKAKDGFSSCD